ncbi:hypothetical protein [Paenibacillus pabuli]|uniref:hypothetical protein n=1 Tax=Paenibacillus pabuli TaxID=1472 RepID=UPI000B2185FE|nr:hypothetical protein [Paenibacillus pabuli]MEC0127070.1 hypothetical protein [Paenibacillus pabuli]
MNQFSQTQQITQLAQQLTQQIFLRANRSELIRISIARNNCMISTKKEPVKKGSFFSF